MHYTGTVGLFAARTRSDVFAADAAVDIFLYSIPPYFAGESAIPPAFYTGCPGIARTKREPCVPDGRPRTFM